MPPLSCQDSFVDLTTDQTSKKVAKRVVFEVQKALSTLSISNQYPSRKRDSSWIDNGAEVDLISDQDDTECWGVRGGCLQARRSPVKQQKIFITAPQSHGLVAYQSSAHGGRSATVFTPQKWIKSNNSTPTSLRSSCSIAVDEDDSSRSRSAPTPGSSRNQSCASWAFKSNQDSDLICYGTKESPQQDLSPPHLRSQECPSKYLRTSSQIIDSNDLLVGHRQDAKAIGAAKTADDDNDDLDLMILENYQHLSKTARDERAANTDQGIFDVEDYLTDEEFDKKLKELNLKHKIEERRKILAKPLEIPRTTISSIRFGNSTLIPGKTVELEDGSFLRIEALFEQGDGSLILRGKNMFRTTARGFPFPKRINELVWVAEMTGDQVKTASTPPSREVRFSQVKKVRQITFTNQQYPKVSSRDSFEKFESTEQMRDEGRLFCRWKHTSVHWRPHIVEEIIEHISVDEADTKLRGIDVSPKGKPGDIRAHWRERATKLGGSHSEFRKTFCLEGKMKHEHVQKFTMGDAFCGAGGASRGAQDAGLFVVWGFDKEPKAIASYKSNFEKFGTQCINQPVDVFLNRESIVKWLVDLLHISPPCQPFSPAHTVASLERDEMNEAALFSVHQLLEKIKPRIVTLEETAGLLSRHKPYFFTLINIFLSLGYSVRWANLNLARWGVGQKRVRLCVVASG